MPRNSELLLNADRLDPYSQVLAGGRLVGRVEAAGFDRAFSVPKNLPMAHCLIYARPKKYANLDIAPRSHNETLDVLESSLEDNRKLSYPVDRRGTTLVVATGSEHDRAYKNLTSRFGADVFFADSEVSHPEAYNRALAHLGSAEGIIAMSEVGNRWATREVLFAGALAVSEGFSAVQGTILADKEAGIGLAVGYAAGTLSPRFWGSKPRAAKPGPGFCAVNRTVFDIEALDKVRSVNQHGGGPFDTRFGNGGYDGHLGDVLDPGSVCLDWAATIISREAAPIGVEQANRLLKEWGTYSHPNQYLDPMPPSAVN